MPGWNAGSSANTGPGGGIAMSGRERGASQSGGKAPSYKVHEVQQRVDQVKGIMCARARAPALRRAAAGSLACSRPARIRPCPSYARTPSLRRTRRQENVEVMLQNIDKTEVLENKSAALADQAKTFHRTARATKRQMCKQNAKMNLILGCVCILLLIAVLVPLIGYFSPLINAGGGDDASPSPAPPPSPEPLPPPSPSPSPPSPSPPA